MKSDEMPDLPQGECSEWLQPGRRVNAFPWPYRPFDESERRHWEPKHYSRAPLYTADQTRAYALAARAQVEAECEKMRAALNQAEACMSIVEPRSDKAEYLRILGVVRAALEKP